MCIICVELQNNKLSPWEATRNLSEMIEEIEEEHALEVLDLILTIQEETDSGCIYCGGDPCACE
jgi:hypothetical protein